MMSRIPNFITHYSRGEPFLSITSLHSEKWPQVIENLNEFNSWGLNRFSDPDYLTRRLKLEEILRLEFLAKGGKPELPAPIYFFLGRNPGFENHPRNYGYTIYLT